MIPEDALCDTSVIIRFVHDHEDDEQVAADALRSAWFENRTNLVFLDLGVYEFVNVLVRRLGRSAQDAATDTDLLFDFDLELVPCGRELAVRTAQIAGETRLTAYDAAFVAAARMLDIPLITADEEIATAAPDTAVALRTISPAA